MGDWKSGRDYWKMEARRLLPARGQMSNLCVWSGSEDVGYWLRSWGTEKMVSRLFGFFLWIFHPILRESDRLFNFGNWLCMKSSVIHLNLFWTVSEIAAWIGDSKRLMLKGSGESVQVELFTPACTETHWAKELSLTLIGAAYPWEESAKKDTWTILVEWKTDTWRWEASPQQRFPPSIVCV